MRRGCAVVRNCGWVIASSLAWPRYSNRLSKPVSYTHLDVYKRQEQIAIQRVGFKYMGVGRLVYPGLLQLQSFMSMNAERHSKAFPDQIMRVAQGEASDHDAHNRFYDEYLAVMDMTAEFYLSTVERIFKNREIARNEFMVAGKKVDIGAITKVSVMTVEGSEDDISAPGQCLSLIHI